jgi:hypothetical protein
MLHAPFLVGAAVDDTCHTAYGLAHAVCHPQLVLAYLQRGVLLRIETVHLVEEKRRTVIWAVRIQIIGELNESFQFVFGMDGAYLNGHGSFVFVCAGLPPAQNRLQRYYKKTIYASVPEKK